MSTITILALSLALQSPATAQTQSEVDNIMDTYAAASGASIAASAACNPITIRTKYNGDYGPAFIARVNTVTSDLERAQFANVIARGDNSASAFAYCYKNQQTSSDLPEAAYHVSQFLLLKYLGFKGIGEENAPQSLATKSHATTLLNYAGNNGYTVESDLKLLGTANTQASTPQGSPPSDDTVSAKARDLYNELTSNKLRFERKYSGKRLSVTGPVDRVGEYTNIIIKILASDLPHDDRLQSSWITCEIPKDSPSVDAAIDLNKGQTTSVTGSFNELGVYGEIRLSDCSVDP